MKFFDILIPIAVLLFIVKETIESLKKRNEKKRKLEVIKLFLIEELEHNVLVFDGLLSISRSIKYIIDNKDKKIKYNLSVDRYNEEFVSIKYGLEIEEGINYRMFLQFDLEVFDKYNFELMSLDKKAYYKVFELYKKIRYLIRIRNDFSSFLDNNLDDTRKAFLLINLSIIEEREKYEREFSEVYKILTNKDSIIKNGKIISDKELIKFYNN